MRSCTFSPTYGRTFVTSKFLTPFSIVCPCIYYYLLYVRVILRAY